jgi:hypothetical protein
VLGRDFDLRDCLDIVTQQLTQRDTRDLALAFVTTHLDELLARMRDDEAAGFLGALAGTACDPDRRAKIAALIGPRATRIGGAEVYVSRALEQADQCIAQLQRQLPALHHTLDSQ